MSKFEDESTIDPLEKSEGSENTDNSPEDIQGNANESDIHEQIQDEFSDIRLNGGVGVSKHSEFPFQEQGIDNLQILDRAEQWWANLSDQVRSKIKNHPESPLSPNNDSLLEGIDIHNQIDIGDEMDEQKYLQKYRQRITKFFNQLKNIKGKVLSEAMQSPNKELSEESANMNNTSNDSGSLKNMSLNTKNKENLNPKESYDRNTPTPIETIDGDAEVGFDKLKSLLNKAGSVVLRKNEEKISWYSGLHLHETDSGENALRLQPMKERRVFKDGKDQFEVEAVGPSFEVYPDLFFQKQEAEKIHFLKSDHSPADIGLGDLQVDLKFTGVPENLEVFGYKSASELWSESVNGLIKDDESNVWKLKGINKRAPTPHAELAEVSGQQTVNVPLQDNQGEKFSDKYEPITDRDEAKQLTEPNNQEVQESSPKSENDAKDRGESAGSDVEYAEKQPDESEFTYIYNRVDPSQKELLKQISNELADSEYEGVDRLRKKLSEDPAEVLRAVSGMEGSSAREYEFPKQKVLQTLGSIERLNGEVVSRENVENMVTAGYDSEWDVWQRIKTNHVYQTQDGTVFVNLSEGERKLWTKFEDMQTYRRYKDPDEEGKPMGRKRGMGGILERIEKDIDSIKGRAKSTEQTETMSADMSPGDMVMLTEQGSPRWSEYHAVEDMMRNDNGELLIRTDKGSAYWPVEKFKLEPTQDDEGDTTEQAANSFNGNETNAETKTAMATKEEIREIIHNFDSPDQAIDNILQEDTLFWNEDKKAIREGQNWVIYSDMADDKVNEFSHEEMKQQLREVIIAMNEKNKLKIDNFVDSVINSVNKIVQALPEDESTDDEEDFKAEYQEFRNQIVADNDLLSRQEVKRYRDRFVQLMHYYKNERSELWHRSEAIYRTDVKEAVADIDQMLENSLSS